MKKLVIVLFVFAALTACGSPKEDAQNQPTVEHSVYDFLEYLPLGEYPAGPLYCTGYANLNPLWGCAVWADPTRSGSYKLYAVSPKFLRVAFDSTDTGSIVVKYNDVLLHQPAR